MIQNEEKTTNTEAPIPSNKSLEDLFKDYSGESFITKLINPIEPEGNEQW